MLLWLLRWLEGWLQSGGPHEALEMVQYITFRASMASVTAFVAALGFGPAAIRALSRRCPETIASDSPYLDQLHQHKSRTPTMGGLFLMAGLMLSALLWGDLDNRYVQLALLLGVGLAFVGAIDDGTKLHSGRKGLRVRTKLLAQLAVSAPIVWVLYHHQASSSAGLYLFLPGLSEGVLLGAGFVLLAMLVLIASTNAVNLTDGLDGLASGCLIFAGSGMGVISYLAGHVHLANYLSIPYVAGSGELTVVLAAMVGAVLGFLWFNCHPAQVFMGDTGSLPLGGLLGFVAVVVRQEWVLVLIGGIFVVEAASVIAQVLSYKWRRRRVLRCAPLHHHFQFLGWHETKIVVRFWIAAALLAILAVASLKIH